MMARMLAGAMQAVVLADGSKVGATSRLQVCSVEEIDLLMAGSSAGAEQVDELPSAGLAVRLNDVPGKDLVPCACTLEQGWRVGGRHVHPGHLPGQPSVAAQQPTFHRRRTSPPRHRTESRPSVGVREPLAGVPRYRLPRPSRSGSPAEDPQLLIGIREPATTRARPEHGWRWPAVRS